MIAIHDQPLVSNGYTLSNAPHRLGRLIPTDPHAPQARLREQYAEQGYLWLRGVLDRSAVLALRRRYFRAMEPTGLITPGSDPTAGNSSGGPIDLILHGKLLMEFVRSAAYEAFCLDARI